MYSLVLSLSYEQMIHYTNLKLIASKQLMLEKFKQYTKILLQFEIIIIIYKQLALITMGLWPWFTSQLFTYKFWKSVKKDGWLLTYQRGHKAVMNSHTVGGNTTRAKMVGLDQYGNKYYQDFDAVHYNQRRWVQFNDFLSMRSPNGDMIPPKWHGWLSHQYDDIPAPDGDCFHDPFFEKSHDWNSSSSPFRTYTSKGASINPLAIDYKNYRMGRYAKQWTPATKRQ